MYTHTHIPSGMCQNSTSNKTPNQGRLVAVLPQDMLCAFLRD